MNIWRTIIVEVKRLSGKYPTRRFAGLLVFAVGVLLVLSWDPPSMINLNLASIHLTRGAARAISPTHPYVFDGAGRLELAKAVERAQQGQREIGASNRLACVLLRAHFLSMTWQQARAVVESGACNDVSIGGFKALTPIVEGLRAVEQGELVRSRREFHKAMTVSGGLLSQSLKRWLGPSPLGTRPWLAENTPRFLVGKMVDRAWQPMPEPASSQWSLVGYDLDEAALETGQPVAVSLFWQQHQPDVPVPEILEKAGLLWRQDTFLVNMIPDAGFEWAGGGLETWNLPKTGEVVSIERNGSRTYGLRILPDPGGSGSIASTPVLPLITDCLYLMGGWVASDGAAPVFSIVWDGLPNDVSKPPFTNLMEGARDLAWTHVSQLVQAKPGARGVSVYASNWALLWAQATHPPRSMQVDNVFLFPITAPDSPACEIWDGERAWQ